MVGDGHAMGVAARSIEGSFVMTIGSIRSRRPGLHCSWWGYTFTRTIPRQNGQPRPRRKKAMVPIRSAVVSAAVVRFTRKELTTQYAQNTYRGTNPHLKSRRLHDLLPRVSTLSPHGWICGSEHSRWAVFPNPGMDHPLCFGGEVAALRRTLAFTHVRVRASVGQHADVGMAMPLGQGLRKRRVCGLSVNSFWSCEQITDAHQGVAIYGGRILFVKQNCRPLNVEAGAPMGTDEMSSHAGHVGTDGLVAIRFGCANILVSLRGMTGSLQQRGCLGQVRVGDRNCRTVLMAHIGVIHAGVVRLHVIHAGVSVMVPGHAFARPLLG
jgi:hypothetical protein